MSIKSIRSKVASMTASAQAGRTESGLVEVAPLSQAKNTSLSFISVQG